MHTTTAGSPLRLRNELRDLQARRPDTSNFPPPLIRRTRLVTNIPVSIIQDKYHWLVYEQRNAKLTEEERAIFPQATVREFWLIEGFTLADNVQGARISNSRDPLSLDNDIAYEIIDAIQSLVGS